MASTVKKGRYGRQQTSDAGSMSKFVVSIQNMQRIVRSIVDDLVTSCLGHLELKNKSHSGDKLTEKTELAWKEMYD